MTAIRLLIGGRVQGVGFRPFVYRLAQAHRLTGWIRNGAGIVEIQARGPASVLKDFAEAIIAQSPTIAHPRLIEYTNLAEGDIVHDDFRILPSCPGTTPRNYLPPDYAVCPDCLAELENPLDRRYRYPFINCTQCGPRYSLITALPYDRPNTTLSGFPMCADCQQEYQDPHNRRFHAEPIACAVCGPQLSFIAPGEYLDGSGPALAAAVSALHRGAIIAIKGIGGYHLVCDARNESAVKRLRTRKPRPDKPLAVLFGEDLSDLYNNTEPDHEHAVQLQSPARPIVLIPLRSDHVLAASIAPCLTDIGAMLPYSPLHHLLCKDFGAPLVTTSANSAGQPVFTEAAEAEQYLTGIADAWLHHNRPITRPVDDSVMQVIAGRARNLRIGRGLAPLELELPWRLEQPILAVGGHIKNTVALAWDNRIVVSPHLGELDSPRALALFEKTITDLQRLYAIEAETIIYDAHPGYASTQWAKGQTLPANRVWHHHAHASAVVGEHPGPTHWLAFTWDSVGLGPDGTLWGGETLYGSPGCWKRVGYLRPFRLPGGNRASYEPWRSAAALCWEIELPWPRIEDDMPSHVAMLLRKAWDVDLNCHTTTAAGRIFDGAAALLGLVRQTSFEGQGPMYLEALAKENAEAVQLPLSLDPNGLWITDWAPLIPMLCDVRHRSAAERAASFHESLAQAIIAQVHAMQHYAVDAIALAGGVFQNRRLTERVLQLLRNDGYTVHLGESIPCNDAGLCFGQIVDYAGQDDE